MPNKQHILPLLCGLSIAALAGCSKSPERTEQVTGAQESSPVTAGAADVSEPLTQDQVGATYQLAGAPVLEQGGQRLVISVLVKNTGSVALASQGDKPVNLGISIVDESGEVVDQDFARAALPEPGIGAGAEAIVVANVPAERVAGKKLRFGLVQEGVAWFTGLGVAPLDYGPLSSCEHDGARTLCGPEGQALSQR